MMVQWLCQKLFKCRVQDSEEVLQLMKLELKKFNYGMLYCKGLKEKLCLGSRSIISKTQISYKFWTTQKQKNSDIICSIYIFLNQAYTLAVMNFAMIVYIISSIMHYTRSQQETIHSLHLHCTISKCKVNRLVPRIGTWQTWTLGTV